MDKKTSAEIKAWAEDPKRKAGEKLMVADEPTTSQAVDRMKVEVKKL
uniref:Uncharacterized protein n=1 Tax=viral metagenome TaxID=1070528 RepID=A0A6M3KHI7_9ZZZZ